MAGVMSGVPSRLSTTVHPVPPPDHVTVICLFLFIPNHPGDTPYTLLNVEWMLQKPEFSYAGYFLSFWFLNMSHNCCSSFFFFLLANSILLHFSLITFPHSSKPLDVVVVQSLSRVWLSVTPWTAAHQASLSLTISRSLLKLMSIELVRPSNHLILWRPLLLLPSVFPSIRVFSNELALHIRWPKCWSFSISPSKEYSGLISFRIDWFGLLAVLGTLKSI